MSERDKQLSKSWLGEILLAGKPLKQLSIGRMQKLELVGNKYFDDSSAQNDFRAMTEIVFSMSCDAVTFGEYCRFSETERAEMLANFALLHEDELETVIEQVAESVARIGMAKMESASEGKETRHV
jgi:hypothetical protein